MSTDDSPSINAAEQPAKVKRKKDQQQQAAVSSSNKRRSLRDRSSLATPDAGKLSPMEIIGSLTFDIARSEDGWKMKERGVTRTFASDCGKKFDSFEAIGEFAIADKDRMEKLADDEGAIGALQRLARDGEKRAIAALESLGISVEEDKEDVQNDTRPASPANRAGDVKSKSRKKRFQSKSQKKGSKKKQGRKASQGAAKRGNTDSAARAATPGQPFRLAELDVTGMFDPKHNYCDVAGSKMSDTPACFSKFSFELKDLNVVGMFDPERNYTVTPETVAGKNED